MECGGKSPTYIEESADLKVALKRILWGKLANVNISSDKPKYIDNKI